jgi:hypothetical protein
MKNSKEGKIKDGSNIEPNNYQSNTFQSTFDSANQSTREHPLFSNASQGFSHKDQISKDKKYKDTQYSSDFLGFNDAPKIDPLNIYSQMYGNYNNAPIRIEEDSPLDFTWKGLDSNFNYDKIINKDHFSGASNAVESSYVSENFNYDKIIHKDYFSGASNAVESSYVPEKKVLPDKFACKEPFGDQYSSKGSYKDPYGSSSMDKYGKQEFDRCDYNKEDFNINKMEHSSLNHNKAEAYRRERFYSNDCFDNQQEYLPPINNSRDPTQGFASKQDYSSPAYHNNLNNAQPFNIKVDYNMDHNFKVGAKPEFKKREGFSTMPGSNNAFSAQSNIQHSSIQMNSLYASNKSKNETGIWYYRNDERHLTNLPQTPSLNYYNHQNSINNQNHYLHERRKDFESSRMQMDMFPPRRLNSVKSNLPPLNPQYPFNPSNSLNLDYYRKELPRHIDNSSYHKHERAMQGFAGDRMEGSRFYDNRIQYDRKPDYRNFDPRSFENSFIESNLSKGLHKEESSYENSSFKSLYRENTKYRSPENRYENRNYEGKTIENVAISNFFKTKKHILKLKICAFATNSKEVTCDFTLEDLYSTFYRMTYRISKLLEYPILSYRDVPNLMNLHRICKDNGGYFNMTATQLNSFKEHFKGLAKKYLMYIAPLEELMSKNSITKSVCAQHVETFSTATKNTTQDLRACLEKGSADDMILLIYLLDIDESTIKPILDFFFQVSIILFERRLVSNWNYEKTFAKLICKAGTQKTYKKNLAVLNDLLLFEIQWNILIKIVKYEETKKSLERINIKYISNIIGIILYRQAYFKPSMQDSLLNVKIATEVKSTSNKVNDIKDALMCVNDSKDSLIKVANDKNSSLKSVLSNVEDLMGLEEQEKKATAEQQRVPNESKGFSKIEEKKEIKVSEDQMLLMCLCAFKPLIKSSKTIAKVLLRTAKKNASLVIRSLRTIRVSRKVLEKIYKLCKKYIKERIVYYQDKFKGLLDDKKELEIIVNVFHYKKSIRKCFKALFKRILEYAEELKKGRVYFSKRNSSDVGLLLESLIKHSNRIEIQQYSDIPEISQLIEKDK